MANHGSFYKSIDNVGGGDLTVYCNWTQTMTDTQKAQRKSTVTVSLVASISPSSYQRSIRSASVTIDGSSHSFTIDQNYRYSNNETIGTWSKEVSHDNDGSKSCTISFSVTSNKPTTAGASATVTLDRTDRVQYTVSFNANGGSGTIADATKEYDLDLTLPSSGFTMTGYHMTAWRKNSISGTAYALGGSYSDNEACTMYAMWTINTYSVRFNANGGSGSMSNESFTYGESKALTSNAFTRQGYAFKGWATSADGAVVYANGETVTNLTENDGVIVDLYAVWAKSGMRVKHSGEWKDGEVYAKVNGEWKSGQVYAKDGTWKEGS